MGTKSEKPAGPVYFRALEVENVRCFGTRQRLDLTDAFGRPARWTLILGDNGTGKTTLLQCLALMWPTKRQGDHRERRWGPRWLHDAGKWDPLARTPDDAAAVVIELVSGERELVDRTWYTVEAGSFTEWESIGIALDEPHHFGLTAYGAARHMGSADLAGTLDGDPTASLFDPRAPLLNPEEWLLRLDYQALRENGRGTARQLLEQVKALLVRLLPDVSAIELAPPTTGAKAASLEGTVRFVTPYGPVGLRGLGLGYQTMIAWMVDLAARMVERYPDSDDPLSEPAVVLIDEIDLHLHPRWQRGIVQFLTERFPNVQFIATAHSPLVVQASADANVVVLRREGDEVRIDSDPKIVRGWRVDQLLLSDVFGLDSVRPPAQAALLRERTALLAKPRLTKANRQRLAAIEAELGPLPTAADPLDQDALDIIREAAARLRGKDAGQG